MAEPSNRTTEARIHRIENNLMPGLQIAGEPVPVWNLRERLEELGVPGLSMAFLHEGQVEWSRAYGMADVSESRAVTPETLFLAGSVSKPIAALRTLQLAEEGAVNLDHNVNDYLTSWQLPDNEFTAREKVTLRRILNHTAGLTVRGFPGYDDGDEIPSVVDVLDGKGNTGAVRVFKEPGESWNYSGGGYTIMQLLVTDVVGQTFPATMREHVLDPLGMDASTFENPLPKGLHGLAATGYRTDGSEVEGKWPIYPEMAAAGLWSTPSQLLRYPMDIQATARTGEKGLLTKQTVDTMLTPGMNNHGLGPSVTEHIFLHNGGDEGFRTTLIAWRGTRDALAVMVNSDEGRIVLEVALSVVAEYDLPGFGPVMKTVVQVPPEKRELLVGTYEVPGGGPIVITTRGDGILAEVSNGQRGFFEPESERVFFNRHTGITLEFHAEDSRRVTGVTLPGNLFARKIE